MTNSLKDNLKDTQKTLSETLEDVEDKLEDAAEDSRELWQKTRDFLQKLSSKLAEEAQLLEQSRDEVRLQSHLGFMEAHKRVDAIHETLAEFASQTRNKSQHLIDQAQLRASLAKMEARDFAKEAREDINSEIQQDASKLRAASEKVGVQLKAAGEKLRARIKGE